MEKFPLICFLGYVLIQVIGFELSMVMEMLKKLVIKYLSDCFLFLGIFE
jgi:hypothetical protein